VTRSADRAFSVEELQVLTTTLATEAAAAIGKDRETPSAPRPRKGLASSLYMAQPLTGQILRYFRVLDRAFDRTVADLATIASDDLANQLLTHQLGDERGRVIVQRGIDAFLTAADRFFPPAFDLGDRTAVRFTGRQRISDSERALALDKRLARNARFVRERLFVDLGEMFLDVLRDPTLPAAKAPSPDTAPEAVHLRGDLIASRIQMYATPLWGVGHEAFRMELDAAQRVFDWQTTSLEPCAGCQLLEIQSPYGPHHPLPTVPGAGDTPCRTNCLCLLVEVD